MISFHEIYVAEQGSTVRRATDCAMKTGKLRISIVRCYHVRMFRLNTVYVIGVAPITPVTLRLSVICVRKNEIISNIEIPTNITHFAFFLLSGLLKGNDETLAKIGQLLKERICSLWEQILSIEE